MQTTSPIPSPPAAPRRPRSRLPGLALGLAALASSAGSALALESVRLTDVIKSNGTGNIALFKDVTAATLEALRLAHGGKLVFGVDVNEAADGSEKASTQGLALKSVKLTATFPGNVTRVYQSTALGAENNCCTTKTKTSLAERPGNVRTDWYTLLGESGSSRITASNAIQSQFDDTLTIKVADSLAGATSVVLDIVLLDTNSSLGDPEAFYDFSNGFEDLALLNQTDAAFIDAYGAGRDEAPGVVILEDPLVVKSWSYFPAANRYYLAGYEDLYPALGDYDFNDLTVAFQVRQGFNFKGEVVAIHGTAYLLTRGAAYSHDWHLGFNLPAGTEAALNCTLQRSPTDPAPRPCSSGNIAQTSGTADVLAFENTRAIFSAPGSNFVNTLAGSPFLVGPKAHFTLDLATPVAASGMPKAPFNPYLHVRNTNQVIQLLEVNPAFRDASGFPYGMLLPDDWKPPLEKTSMFVAYGAFADFVASRGAQSADWYLQPDPATVLNLPAQSVWAW